MDLRRNAGLRAYAVLATVASIALAYRSIGSSESDSGAGFRLKEGERFPVPIGMVAVITQLDVDSISISDVGVSVDGLVRLRVNPSASRENTTVLVTARSLSELRAWGGLIEEDDAFCSGYLVPESRAKAICD